MLSKIFSIAGLLLTIGPKLATDAEAGYAKIKSATNLYQRLDDAATTFLQVLTDLKGVL